MTTFADHDATFDVSAAPHRDVTPSEFLVAATAAGWEIRTIELALKPFPPGYEPFREFAKVGREMLRVRRGE